VLYGVAYLFFKNLKFNLMKWESSFSHGQDSIVDSVIESFKERSTSGIKKYNTTLDRTDLSTLDWLTHLQEELMDATLYVERLKKEIK
jgi:hypothetical protein